MADSFIFVTLPEHAAASRAHWKAALLGTAAEERLFRNYAVAARLGLIGAVDAAQGVRRGLAIGHHYAGMHDMLLAAIAPVEAGLARALDPQDPGMDADQADVELGHAGRYADAACALAQALGSWIALVESSR
jgi:hypothetical protein